MTESERIALPLIEKLIAYRDGISRSERDDRELLADACNTISSLRSTCADLRQRIAALEAALGEQTGWLIESLLREEGVDLEGWRPIESAPKDGTAIIAYCVHANSKYATNSIQEGWEYPVIAKWIDHNGGGWTWHGMAGTFTHWRPLPKGPADE